MTIVAATLPVIQAGATITEGDLFTVNGNNFDAWPNDIVLGYDNDNVRNGNVAFFSFELKSKTSTELVFRARVTHLYETAHTWSVFGTPSEPPRSILSYQSE